MPNLPITCPSGLRGTVRGLTGKELDLFANRQEIQRRRVARKILDNCWVETEHVPDLYEGTAQTESGKLKMDEVLMCDRFYALLQVRCATHGSKYDFKVQCTEGPCRKRFEWTLDLNKDLDVYELPDETVEAIKNDTPLEGEVNGVNFKYRLLRGKHEETNVKALDLSPDRQATTSLSLRLTEVETPDGEILTKSKDIKKFAETLDYGTTLDIVAVMDRADGGIETEIQVQCPNCGNIMDLELPLGADLWAPKRRSTSAGRKVRPRNQGS